MLYRLDETNKSALTRVRRTTLQNLGWVEKDLENLVSSHIHELVREDQLFVIHQERQGQEQPDILALDKEGNLHIFELKRWQSSPENLLQVLRCGQIVGQYDYAALNDLYLNYVARVSRTASQAPAQAGNEPHKLRERLAQAHREHFDLERQLPHSAFNVEQHFIVVTDGLDRSTREAIDYWGKQGLPVKALTYHVYQSEKGEFFLEFRSYGPEGDTYLEAESGLVVVNTNATYMPDAWREMLENGRASAYFNRKTAVCSIPKGSPIALYHTGVGIIAIGKTLGGYKTAPYGGLPDEEYYVPCTFEVTVDPIKEPHKAVTAREINGHLKASHRFRMTTYTLPPEAEDFVRKTLVEKQKSSTL